MTPLALRCGYVVHAAVTRGIVRRRSHVRFPHRLALPAHRSRWVFPRFASVSDSPKRLWAIVGATGTGKSDLALDLAETLRARGNRAEIVNADAMQLYNGMDIGTAKLPLDERRSIPHHMLDVREVTEDAAVAWYQPLARAAIEEIHSRGGDAILIGGSGLYVSSVIFDFQFPPRDPAVRERLERELEEFGAAALFARLQADDPAT